MTKTILLSTTEVALAHKLGITPQEYAKQRSLYAQQSPVPDFDEYEENPNKIEIMNVPIKTLHDLWAVKFGSTWVDINELDDEWGRICGRLDKYGVFEEHSGGDWVKLKDEL